MKEKALEAYAHGEVPFERVVSEIGVERDTSRTPLFEVMFILQNVPNGETGASRDGDGGGGSGVGRVPFE